MASYYGGYGSYASQGPYTAQALDRYVATTVTYRASQRQQIQGTQWTESDLRKLREKYYNYTFANEYIIADKATDEDDFIYLRTEQESKINLNIYED